jgi:hypothetical protein
MARATYKYAPFPIKPNDVYPQGTTAYRPLVLATVTASTGVTLRCLVLPDSGADACLFPLSLAILLKIDVLKLPKATTGGVGSQGNITYYDTLTIDIGNGIAFSAYVGFTQGLDITGFGLLGQSGFFENYKVEFLHKQKIFNVESA